MKHAYRVLVIVLIALVFSQSAGAVLVGVYSEPRKGDPQGFCVKVRENDNGYRTLSEIKDAEFKSISGQHILCSIDNDVSFICDDGSDRSLRVVMQDNGEWHDEAIASFDAGSNCYDTGFNSLLNFPFYSFTTHTFSNTHYCARQGDVLGIINEERPTHQPGPPDFSLTPTFDELCEPLQIQKINAYVDGRARDVDEVGDKIKNVFPGSELKIELTIKNIGPRDIDREIKDVTVTATLKDINDGLDLEQESQLFDLNSRDTADVAFTFDIPILAEEDTYGLIISLEGEDENSFSYEPEFAFEVDVEQEKHKLLVEDLTSEHTKMCPGDSGAITARISNIGSSDEQGTFSLTSGDLGISASRQFEIKESRASERTTVEEVFPISLSSKTAPGKYAITGILNYPQEKLSYTLNLNVVDCEKTSSRPKTVKTPENIIIQGAAISPPKSKISRYAPVLILPLIVLFVIYAYLLTLLLKRYDRE